MEPLHLLSVHGERGGRGGLRQLQGKGGVAVVERVAGGREGHGDVQRAHHGGQVDGGLRVFSLGVKERRGRDEGDDGHVVGL